MAANEWMQSFSTAFQFNSELTFDSSKTNKLMCLSQVEYLQLLAGICLYFNLYILLIH